MRCVFVLGNDGIKRTIIVVGRALSRLHHLRSDPAKPCLCVICQYPVRRTAERPDPPRPRCASTNRTTGAVHPVDRQSASGSSNGTRQSDFPPLVPPKLATPSPARKVR